MELYRWSNVAGQFCHAAGAEVDRRNGHSGVRGSANSVESFRVDRLGVECSVITHHCSRSVSVYRTDYFAYNGCDVGLCPRGRKERPLGLPFGSEGRNYFHAFRAIGPTHCYSILPREFEPSLRYRSHHGPSSYPSPLNRLQKGAYSLLFRDTYSGDLYFTAS